MTDQRHPLAAAPGQPRSRPGPVEAVEKLRGVFRQWPQINRVLLYGSRGKGNYRTGSDIDLTIEADRMSLPQMLALENQIDDLLSPWMVDLSLKSAIENAALLEHIERVGVPFFVRETGGVAD
jgi:predicted nucleotidyltransferase